MYNVGTMGGRGSVVAQRAVELADLALGGRRRVTPGRAIQGGQQGRAPGKTDRFRAAVSAKPVINWYSFVLTADSYNFLSNYGNMPRVESGDDVLEFYGGAADKLVEIKTICHCGRKATMVLRLDSEGQVVRAGVPPPPAQRRQDRYRPGCV